MKNLVRIVTLAAAVAALPAIVSAQDNQFKKDTKFFYAGLLVAGESYGGMGANIGGEVGVAEVGGGVVRLGVGAQLGYLRHTYDRYLTFSNSYHINVMPITAFVNGHYQIEAVPKLDVYAGPVVGVARTTYGWDGAASVYNQYFKSTNDVVVGVQAGARYELTSALMAQLQLSGGSAQLPWANIGVGLKF